MNAVRSLCVLAAAAVTATAVPAQQPLVTEGVVAAPVDSVWNAFTTGAGLETWMAAHATFDLRIGGVMRSVYSPKDSLGGPATIENTILAYEPGRMLTVRVSGVPAAFPFPNAVKQMWTVIYFDPIDATSTRIREVGMGFGPDAESQNMRLFFDRGNAATLAALQKRFAHTHAEGLR